MGVNTKSFDNASDMITFSRASGGYGLTKVSYGPELVTNGTFDTDSDWTKGTGWSISGGVASFSGGTGADLTQTGLNVEANKTYQISFDMTQISGGGCRVVVDTSGSFVTQYFTTTAQHTVVFAVGATSTRLRFAGLGGANLSIDNVSVKEVTYNSSAADATLQLIYHPNDVPRIEYDLDGTAKGLLVEESRTNSITNSESCSFLDQNGGTVTASTTPAPYGMSSTVKRVQSSTFNGGGRLPVTILTAGNSYCSVYVRSRTGADQNLKITASGTSAATQVAPASGDWVRLGKVALFGAGSRDMRVLSTGDTIDLDIALPQVELGSFPTSYIKTTGAPATRSTDIASIPVADFGYNQSEGTLLIQASSSDDAPSFAALSDTTANNRLLSYVSASNIRWYILNGGASQGNLASGVSYSEGDTYKIANAYKTDDFAISVNGETSVTDTSGSMPSGLSILNIGTSNSAGAPINGHIKSIKYYPRRLTDAQLQELTT